MICTLHGEDNCTVCKPPDANSVRVDAPVSGQAMLKETLDRRKETNEDGMPVGKYLDKPSGGATLYIRHDVVVNWINKHLSR